VTPLVGAVAFSVTEYGILNTCWYFISSDFKPSTQIDENRELTIGVSERQIRG